MAYILEINESIIVTKTNPKAIQNQLMDNSKILVKWIVTIYSCKMNTKVGQV